MTSKLITIATTSIFVNIPKQLNNAVPDELLLNVEQQVISQYEKSLELSTHIPPDFKISNVCTKRGCIIVEISIGFSAVATPAIIYAMLRDYKSFKESLYEIAKDIKKILFIFNGKEETKSACVQKITLEQKEAIEEEIRKLKERSNK